MVVWCGGGPDSGSGPAPEYNSFNGRIHGWSSYGSAWDSGYEAAHTVCGEGLDFWQIGKLEFEKPDMDTFYALSLAYEAGREGGTLPTVFNASNELAVKKFLKREIKYLEITEIIEDCMRAHHNIKSPTLEQVFETEAAVYERIESRR